MMSKPCFRRPAKVLLTEAAIGRVFCCRKSLTAARLAQALWCNREIGTQYVAPLHLRCREFRNVQHRTHYTHYTHLPVSGSKMIKILGGDFGENKHADLRTTYFTGKLKAIVIPKWLIFSHTIRRDEIASVELVTDKNKVNVASAIGGAAVGAILAGPLGMLAGSLLAGKGKAVVLHVTLTDGRQFICSAKPKDHELLLAAAMSS